MGSCASNKSTKVATNNMIKSDEKKEDKENNSPAKTVEDTVNNHTNDKERLNQKRMRTQLQVIQEEQNANTRSRAQMSTELMNIFKTYEGTKDPQGLPHGFGKIIWHTNQDSYEGEWWKGQYHGYGEFWDNTYWIRYAGEFLEGKKHGLGALELPSGDTYIGQFQNDVQEGHGVLYYENGGYYWGQFQKGFRHGEGMMCYPDKYIYDGMWQNDVRHGFGWLTYPDQVQKYKGMWDRDLQTGQGKLRIYHLDARVLNELSGNFINGKLQGPGTLTDHEGNVYEGNFRDNMPDGKGALQKVEYDMRRIATPEIKIEDLPKPPSEADQKPPAKIQYSSYDEIPVGIGNTQPVEWLTQEFIPLVKEELIKTKKVSVDYWEKSSEEVEAFNMDKWISRFEKSKS